MVIFETRVSVPRHILEQIGNEIRGMFFNELELNFDEWDINFSRDDLNALDEILQSTIQAYAAKSEKSCDGWRLDRHQAETIAREMRQGHKIMAIKEFRGATGAGLRDAKEFIEKFGSNGTGDLAAIEFMAVFV